jgi:hypothetical protein
VQVLMVNMAAIAVIDAQEKGKKKSKFNLNVVNYKCVKSNKWT